jgi:hypothetical protein
LCIAIKKNNTHASTFYYIVDIVAVEHNTPESVAVDTTEKPIEEIAGEKPVHKGSENLRPPWSKDNPPPVSGGPKGPHLTTILKSMMGCRSSKEAEEKIRSEYPELSEKKITRAHVYMSKLDIAASEGAEWALKMVLDRTEGRAQERVELSGGLKNEIEIDPSKLSPEEIAVLCKIADSAKTDADTAAD